MVDINEEIDALGNHLKQFLNEKGEIECTVKQFTIMIEHINLIESMVIKKAIEKFNIDMPDYMS